MATRIPGYPYTRRYRASARSTLHPEDADTTVPSATSRIFEAPFRAEDIDSCLQGVRDSAPGFDGVTYSVIKHLPKQAKQCLARLIHHFWITAVHPTEWKKTLVLPFLKPQKDAQLPQSYRPIALTSCFFKTFQKIALFRPGSNFKHPDNLINTIFTHFLHKCYRFVIYNFV